MKFNNWGLPWVKTKGRVIDTTTVEGTSGETKVFARIKERGRTQPSMALVVIKGPDRGREFLLAPLTVKIGRQMQSHIRLKDPKVSREHAVLQYHAKKQTFLLRDLGSTNGTFCNNHRITSTFVSPGDEIRFGESVLKVIALEKKKNPGETGEVPVER